MSFTNSKYIDSLKEFMKPPKAKVDEKPDYYNLSDDQREFLKKVKEYRPYLIDSTEWDIINEILKEGSYARSYKPILLEIRRRYKKEIS